MCVENELLIMGGGGSDHDVKGGNAIIVSGSDNLVKVMVAVSI
jgi:hypothetical protein